MYDAKECYELVEVRGGRDLYIEKLEVKGIGGIKDLALQFHPGLNLICGPNGIGKTTILECIAHSFIEHGSDKLQRNVGCEEGKWLLEVKKDENLVRKEWKIENYHPTERGYCHGFGDYAKDIIVFKTNRSIDYQSIESITKDPVKDKYNIMSEATTGNSSFDIKSWFLNRFLWSKHEGSLSSAQVANLEVAKECFGKLDEKVNFSRVVPNTHDILVSTSDGEIYFEYLSSGYKSSLFILLGLIKSIEHRNQEQHLKIIDFDGVILIDEIDLHLHPQWQAKLIEVMKSLLPLAQIIATTHSPHMIQVADQNEIIPLGYTEENKLVKRDVQHSEYGFQGWTVEEILIDVMGLQESRSEAYIAAIKAFDNALIEELQDEAIKAYEVLDKMLHPNNHLRKVYKIQLNSLGGNTK